MALPVYMWDIVEAESYVTICFRVPGSVIEYVEGRHSSIIGLFQRPRQDRTAIHTQQSFYQFVRFSSKRKQSIRFIEKKIYTYI